MSNKEKNFTESCGILSCCGEHLPDNAVYCPLCGLDEDGYPSNVSKETSKKKFPTYDQFNDHYADLTIEQIYNTLDGGNPIIAGGVDDGKAVKSMSNMITLNNRLFRENDDFKKQSNISDKITDTVVCSMDVMITAIRLLNAGMPLDEIINGMKIDFKKKLDKT